MSPDSPRVEASALGQIDLFSRLSEAELESLAACFERVEVEAEQTVFEEGDPATHFWILASGTVAVIRDSVGEPVQLLTRLQGYDFFGELGLFGSGRYQASVRATEACRLWRIHRRDFVPVVDRHPGMKLVLQSAASQRQSHRAASVLELGRRREVRIRCRRPVVLEMAPSDPDHPGERLELDLENLSLGGICLGQAPETWQPGRELSFGLVVREGVLPLHGAVRWRRGQTVGIAFERRSERHDMLLQMAIRLIMEASD